MIVMFCNIFYVGMFLVFVFATIVFDVQGCHYICPTEPYMYVPRHSLEKAKHYHAVLTRNANVNLWEAAFP